jgi:hypothetical protein
MCYVIDVINDKTEKNGYETIEFYEAARIAFMKSGLGFELKDTALIMHNLIFNYY